MLSIDDFRKITLDDKILFDRHYKSYPPFHSDNVFTTLVSWMDYADYHYVFYKNHLIIFSNIDDKIRFRPPSGKRKKEVFDDVISLAKNQDVDYPLGVIDIETKKWMKNTYPNINYKSHRAYFDYIYLSSDLAELKGTSYSKIRNRLNKFKKNNEYSTEPISENNLDEIKKFLKRWCLWKDCESDPILKYEKKAILFSIRNFFDLKLSGIIIRVYGKIEAISVYEKMKNDTAIVHYEKGSPDYDGIYKAINQESAKIIQNNYKFINRESDMGISGLRRAKMSYKPYRMIEVYHIDKKGIKI